jgi:hypothetical protein
MAESTHLLEASAALERTRTAVAAAAREPDGWREAPAQLRALERALIDLSARWTAVAALAAPTIGRLRDGEVSPPSAPGLSREQEVSMISAFHDVAADLAAAARSCRNGRAVIAPLIERRIGAGPGVRPPRIRSRPRG